MKYPIPQEQPEKTAPAYKIISATFDGNAITVTLTDGTSIPGTAITVNSYGVLMLAGGVVFYPWHTVACVEVA
jgi:hypothetical protein